MSAEGFGWLKHDVPEAVAEFRGKVIARHLKLPYHLTDLFRFSDIEDEGVRFDTSLGVRDYAGLYRSVITAIAEAKEEDYENEETIDPFIGE